MTAGGFKFLLKCCPVRFIDGEPYCSEEDLLQTFKDLTYEKENPMTNIEKFEEVYGFKPSFIEETDAYICPAPDWVCEDQAKGCESCPFHGWWHKEYKGCFQITRTFTEDEVNENFGGYTVV